MEPKVETKKLERRRMMGYGAAVPTLAAPQVGGTATGIPWPAAGPTEAVLLSLAKVVEQRDNHTAGHCERLAFTGVALGVAMGLDNRQLLSLYLGGYLH